MSGAASNGALLHSILFEGAVLGTLFLSAMVSLVARIILINDIAVKKLYCIYAAAALTSLTVLLSMDYQLQQSAFLRFFHRINLFKCAWILSRKLETYAALRLLGCYGLWLGFLCRQVLLQSTTEKNR